MDICDWLTDYLICHSLPLLPRAWIARFSPWYEPRSSAIYSLSTRCGVDLAPKVDRWSVLFLDLVESLLVCFLLLSLLRSIFVYYTAMWTWRRRPNETNFMKIWYEAAIAMIWYDTRLRFLSLYARWWRFDLFLLWLTKTMIMTVITLVISYLRSDGACVNHDMTILSLLSYCRYHQFLLSMFLGHYWMIHW
jgi:hypothetical protein